MQPSGRLIVSGRRGWRGEEDAHEMLLALTPDGRLDPTWGTGGRFTGPRGSSAGQLALAADGGAVTLTTNPRLTGLLWLTPDGRPRDGWGLAGRVAIRPPAREFALPGRFALSPKGEVYVAYAPRYACRRAGLLRLDDRGLPDGRFGGGDGYSRLPATEQSPQTIGQAVAVGPGDRVYLVAAGSSRAQHIREDFGYPHSIVARLKGWAQLVAIARENERPRPGYRRLRVYAYCVQGTDPSCRVRVDVRDRRGRLVGRARPAHGGPTFVRLRRPTRPSERLTVRAYASDRSGRADEDVLRVTVQRRR